MKQIFEVLPATIDNGELTPWHNPSTYLGGLPSGVVDTDAVAKLAHDRNRLVWKYGHTLQLCEVEDDTP